MRPDAATCIKIYMNFTIIVRNVYLLGIRKVAILKPTSTFRLVISFKKFNFRTKLNVAPVDFSIPGLV